MLSAERAGRLRPLLDAFVEDRPWVERVAADPVEFAHWYSSPRDVEVAGLLAASLAYGRASLFKVKVAGLLKAMGRSPAAMVAEANVGQIAALTKGFVYRFNVGTDVAVLLMGIGAALRRVGSLEALFVESLAGNPWRAALSGFALRVRDGAPREKLVAKLGPERGLHHLLPFAQGGVAKRLNLYLRWMVRGPDSIDRGIWKRLHPRQLMMPVDTHVARISRWLGLTQRRDLTWATVEEVTASLRLLDAEDPVRYDFALCHYGMSGACPVTPVRAGCLACSLKGLCMVGRKK